MAAGLGFKTFTTGEVLTAADTNGYLMQGVLVFASAAARDAAITSPQEGQCCYLKDTDAVLTYSGAAWVGFDDSNAIQNSIVDAKGDLVAASGADTPARLAVGNDGEQIVADSAATTGLRYSATPSASNPILNSSFQIWQRGTSTSGGASGGNFCADRWNAYNTGSVTFSQVATGDTTNVPTIQYAARVQRTAANTGTGVIILNQNVETVNTIPFAGKTVTMSFYARKGANYSMASSNLLSQLSTGTRTDQSYITTGYTGEVTLISQNAVLTTTWQRFTYTATIASNVTEMSMQFRFTPVGTAGAADYFEVTGVQLDVGSVALPFRTYAATIQGELAACQRYYQRKNSVGNGTIFGMGQCQNTTNAYYSIPTPVVFRAAPSVATSSVVGWTASTGTAGGTIAAFNMSADAVTVGITGASGLVAGNASALAGTTSSAYIELSAEL